MAPAGVVLLLVGASAVVLALACPAIPRVVKAGSLYSVVHGSRSYTFDAAWRTEKAWTRTSSDAAWTPVPASAAPWLSELRAALLRDRGVAALALLPAEGGDEIAALRALGYF